MRVQPGCQNLVSTWQQIRALRDGRRLRRVAATYSADIVIELVATESELCLLKTGSVVRLNRTDGKGKQKIKQMPIPRDPRHRGPVVVPPDPIGKKIELNDTWGFSARVPMPRDPKKG